MDTDIVDRVKAVRVKRKKDKKRGEAAEKNGRARSDEVSVYISPITLVMAVVFVALGMAYEFACSLTAVILHEFAHAKAAKKLGYALNRIKLMPYGAALCGSADLRPVHEIAIAAAGPLFNAVLALVFAALWWLVPSSYMFTETFCKCNLYIGMFNLLPVYPLDGGRMALGLLSIKLDRKKSYLAVRIVSAAIGFAALGLFVLSAFYELNVCFLTVGIFMVVSAFIPDQRARYYALFAMGSRRERMNKPLETRSYAVNGSADLGELAKALDADRFCMFAIYDDDFNKIGEIDETALIENIKRYGYETSVGKTVQNAKKIEIA